MNKIKQNILLIGLLFFFSCNAPDKAEHEVKEPILFNDSVFHASYDVVRQGMKGASFSDTIKEIKYFYFSNSEKTDKFELRVLPGLLAESKSILTITDSIKVLYRDTFSTDYLVRNIFSPDTVPSGQGQEVYDRYILNYVQSITKDRFEKYTLKNIKEFFNDIYVSNQKMKDIAELGEIQNKELYNEVLADTTRRIIWFACFDSDEGVDYLMYSSEDKKAIVILQTD